MKQQLVKLMMCVLVVAMGSPVGAVLAQTSNPAQSPIQAQASKQGQVPNTPNTTQNNAVASRAPKTGTNSQASAKPVAAQPTANTTTVPSGAGMIAPPGWTPPAQPQAQSATARKAAPTKKTSLDASKPTTKQKDKTGKAESH